MSYVAMVENAQTHPFLSDVLYSQYLGNALRFDRLKSKPEVPLESTVAKYLGAAREGSQLPRRDSIKRLTVEVGDQYQHVARMLADRMRTQPESVSITMIRNNTGTAP